MLQANILSGPPPVGPGTRSAKRVLRGTRASGFSASPEIFRSRGQAEQRFDLSRRAHDLVDIDVLNSCVFFCILREVCLGLRVHPIAETNNKRNRLRFKFTLRMTNMAQKSRRMSDSYRPSGLSAQFRKVRKGAAANELTRRILQR
jgi:hypothetical protein